MKKHLYSCANPQQFVKCHCLVSGSVFAELDKVCCYWWFLQRHTKCATVAGLVIQEKALHLFSALYPEGTEIYYNTLMLMSKVQCVEHIQYCACVYAYTVHDLEIHMLY